MRYKLSLLPYCFSSRTKTSSAGITLIELLIVIAIIGILSTFSFALTRIFWENQLLKANLSTIGEWIDITRRAALRGESCLVTITTGTVSDKQLVFSANDSSDISASCGSSAEGLSSSIALESPGNTRTYDLSVTSGGAAVSTFTLTRRGTIFNTNTNPTFTSDIIVSLRLKHGNSFSNSQCIRISPLIASISNPSTGNC